MARFEWQARPGPAVADPPIGLHVPSAPEPAIDTSDVSVLVRAYYGPAGPPLDAPAAVKSARLTISRRDADDFQDRQIFLFVDEEPWGKVRYGQEVSREIAPGLHRVRAFNTLFSRTLAIDVGPGAHVRLRTANGFPKAGWLLMIFLHVTYLLVRLERDPP